MALVDAVLVFCAQVLPYLVAAVAVGGWLVAPRADQRRLAVSAVIALVLAAALVALAGLVHEDPRPFVVDPASPAPFPHPPDNGFPSDHTAFAATIAFVVSAVRRRLGVVLLALSVLAGVARVLANVHHVQDIVAALVIAAVAAWMTFVLVDRAGPGRALPGRRRGAPASRDEEPPSGAPSRRSVLLGALGVAGTASACAGPSTTTVPSGQSLAPPTAGVPPPAGVTSPTPRPAPVVLTRLGPDITSGPPSSTAVALTFHGAGDLPLTSAALSIAASAGAGLTVFAVGEWLAANPGLGRTIVAAGHDLGNHTWSHQQLTTLDLAQATTEVRRGADAVAAAVGHPGLLFRPSGTAASTPTIRAAAQAAGYQRCVSYDVDPLDYTDPGADLVTNRTLQAVRPGSIVSLHLGHPGTIEALPGILRGLTARGLTAVPVTSLLAGAP